MKILSYLVLVMLANVNVAFADCKVGFVANEAMSARDISFSFMKNPLQRMNIELVDLSKASNDQLNNEIKLVLNSSEELIFGERKKVTKISYELQNRDEKETIESRENVIKIVDVNADHERQGMYENQPGGIKPLSYYKERLYFALRPNYDLIVHDSKYNKILSAIENSCEVKNGERL